MSVNRIDWTQRIGELKELAPDLTLVQLCRHFGATEPAIKQVCSKHGIKYRRKCKEKPFIGEYQQILCKPWRTTQ